MTFKSDFRKSGARVRRAGGGPRRGGIAVGGGLGGLLLVGLFLMLGGDPAMLADGGGGPEPAPGAGQGAGADPCETGADANRRADCRVEFTGISLDRVWAEQLPAQAGIEYRAPELALFRGGVATGCGAADAATGPFYCPADRTAYFDTSFFDTLVRLGGSDGPLAQQYVVAHEVGHHIQHLEGTLGRSDYGDPGADSDAVRIELQADCYAGIWAHFADKGPEAILEPLTDAQVAQAVETARAIGDDSIQRHSGRGVDPDAWTHGSSEQRRGAFLAGYRSGRMASCDTLGRGAYR
ncbi:KPN_02809 family neutral zinc metallopeptidase [Corynebacterium sphenisci]|uniref:KPN_02809 family neutral zinc metallopeptidase n=1 Tax=Corynebacterium sphenisci TaxID=191493 RepID=UPI0026DFD317|nr:neutral zinc metallopeptidase [Corynebacterium sphenisci]MDO5730236.1 neutral zinc metallopeptidase [Corynebacterium sphenisci]